MCSTSLPWSQVVHATLLGLALLLLGLIAIVLNRIARRASGLGAGCSIVWMLKTTALCLLGMDVFVVLVVAIVHAGAATACLGGLV